MSFVFGLRSMKLLLRSPDTVEVDLLRSRMDVAGFACEVRNQSIRSSLGPAAIEHELWLLRDEDFPDALQLLRDWQESCRRKKGSSLGFRGNRRTSGLSQ